MTLHAGLAASILLATALAAGGAAAQAASEAKPLVRMGVRVDAPPFTWRDAGNDSYLGFLVDLCTDAVTRAGYPFEQVPVTAVQRSAILEGDPLGLDLLCDPTTITLHRMGVFARLEPPGLLSFSPIVFVANGSYAINDDATPLDAPPEGALACLRAREARPAEPGDGEDSAAQTVAAVEQDIAPLYLGAGHVVGASIAPAIRAAIRGDMLQLDPGTEVCPVPQQSHREGIAAFCEGRLAYYFGDLEIVAAGVAAWAARTGEDCPFGIAPRPISYEPYALIISNRQPAFREDFVKALYEVFHHGTAADRFNGHFEGYRMSPFLETLFRINQIPAGAQPDG